MPQKAKSTPPSSAANDKTPALHKAAADGNRAKVKRLLAKTSVKGVNEPDEDGRTPLFCAVEGGNMEVVADMLAAKADVNVAATIGPGMTPLHCSVLLDYPVAVAILANGGADINRRDGNGRAPLHWAAILERPAVVRALIKHGANVNLGDNTKSTPLHLAAKKDHFIVAGILIENNAKLNPANEGGNTPLHDAALNGSSDTAEYLIKARANINKKNKAGRTPLYIAQDCGHNKVADVLIDASNFRDMVAPPPECKSTPEQVYDKMWASIVAIHTSTGASGGGVIIAPDIVATNHHVVEDGGDIFVKTAENRHRISEEEEDMHSAELIDVSDSGGRDLCLLKVEGLECPPIKIRESQTLGIGEDVYAIGNPEGLELSLSAGIISQLREEGHRQIQTTASISQGSSGGGLFDKNGYLVGITTWGVDGDKNNAQNLNFAIPADWLFGILPNKAK